MIVVDASVLVAALLRMDGAIRIRDRLVLANQALHAPELIDLEVMHVLRKGARKANPTAALDEYRLLVLNRHSHAAFLDRIWALRHNVTPYDATYVALAEYLAAPLLTRDARLARAAQGLITVELV